MKRRDFLRTSLFISSMLFANPASIIGQPGTSESLEHKIDREMTTAIGQKGESLGAPNTVFDDGSKLNIRFEYLCGPRGGSGKLRALFYLEREDWFNIKGLDNVRVWFFSKEETNVSKKVYEVNRNNCLNTVTYMPAEYVMHEGDRMVEESKGVGWAMLKKIRINKKTITDIFSTKQALDDVQDYALKQRIVEMGNLVIGDHVWLTEINYHGYGGFDDNLFRDQKVTRAPKLVEMEIWTGEEAVMGFGLVAKTRWYEQYNLGPITGNRRKTSDATCFAPLNVKKLIK